MADGGPASASAPPSPPLSVRVESPAGESLDVASASEPASLPPLLLELLLPELLLPLLELLPESLPELEPLLLPELLRPPELLLLPELPLEVPSGPASPPVVSSPLHPHRTAIRPVHAAAAKPRSMKLR
jgi:hypothetical protein